MGKPFVYYCIITIILVFFSWGTECLNTKFPQPTLLCAKYSVKLIYLFYLSKTFKHRSLKWQTKRNFYFICGLFEAFN